MPPSKKNEQKQQRFAAALRLLGGVSGLRVHEAEDARIRDEQLRILWDNKPDHFDAGDRREIEEAASSFKSQNAGMLDGDAATISDAFGLPSKQQRTITLASYTYAGKGKEVRFPEMDLGGPFEMRLSLGNSWTEGPCNDGEYGPTGSMFEDALNVSFTVTSCTRKAPDRLTGELANQFSGALACCGWLGAASMPLWPTGPQGTLDDKDPTWEDPRWSYARLSYEVIDRTDLDEMETRRRTENPDLWMKRQLQDISRPFVLVKQNSWSKRLLRAFNLFDLGERSGAEAQKVFYYVAALETLMLLKDDEDQARHGASDSSGPIVHRLRESVAWFLGTPADRMDWKKRVSGIYDKRSRFVHDGNFDGEPFLSDEARDVVVRVIKKELWSPPPALDSAT